MYNTLKSGEIKQIGKRTIVNLNGTWAVGESVGADTAETAFDHTCPVPGVLSCATPEFDKVGEFETRFRQFAKMNWKQCTGGVVDLPLDEEALKAEVGVPYQDRNYFWYKKTFFAPDVHDYADLIVLKARWGSKVWLNGRVIGQNDSCFTSARYDVSDIIRWNEENEIVIRVGAHQGVLPRGIVNMEDMEHEKWYPGIWDDVELYCYNNGKIRSVQIAPKVDPRQIVIETELENGSAEPETFTLTQVVKSADRSVVLAEHKDVVALDAGEARAVRCVIPLPDAKLWSPDAPNLYVLETATEGRHGVEPLWCEGSLFSLRYQAFLSEW